MTTDESGFGKRALAVRPDLLAVRASAARPIPDEVRERIAREHSARRVGWRWPLIGALLGLAWTLACLAIGAASMIRHNERLDRKADAHLLTELVACAAGPAWASVYPLTGGKP